MKKWTISLTLIAMLAFPAFGQGAAAASDEVKLQTAAAQHAIIEVLLKEQNFSQVLPEFKKILDLNLTGPNEQNVVKSAWIIVENLRGVRQFAIAEEIVDQTLAETKQNKNKFNLMMLKGKIYNDQGRFQEAKHVYRRAVQLNQD